MFSRSFFADPRELSAAELVADVPHRLPWVGPRACSSTYRASRFPPGVVGPARRLPRSASVPASGPERRCGRCGPPATAATGARAHRRRCRAPRRRGAGPGRGGLRRVVGASPAWAPPTGARNAAAAHRAAVPRLPALARPAGARERPGFLGTSGYGGLDNVSVLERCEGEAARWAERTGGSVVELHAYAVAPTGAVRQVRRRCRGCSSGGCTGCTRRPVGRVSSTNGTSGGRTARCSPARFRGRPGVRTPHPPWLRGRGRRPLRPARGPDGTGGHQRLPGGERVARRAGRARPGRCGPSPRAGRCPARCGRSGPITGAARAARGRRPAGVRSAGTPPGAAKRPAALGVGEVVPPQAARPYGASAGAARGAAAAPGRSRAGPKRRPRLDHGGARTRVPRCRQRGRGFSPPRMWPPPRR
ncbi:hypothetical protein SALBM311S_09024 [Streptomyces alboniger]